MIKGRGPAPDHFVVSYCKLLPPVPTLTIRIIDGVDRGKVFADLPTPISIGRETGNTIQLNDDRVSRFHVKIHTDKNEFVLTDLESTNGTVVNGEDSHLRILRYGDLVRIGRTTMIVGTREQINRRMEGVNSELKNRLVGSSAKESSSGQPWSSDPNFSLKLMEGTPPAVPARLSPGQMAQFIEVIEFLHLNLRRLISEIEPREPGKPIEMNATQWQLLLDLQSRMAEYLRQTGR
jgi:pSer/pThr/pTyr-binding forkhead associated (FHA) protein